METFGTKLGQVERALIAADVFCGHGYDSPHDEAVALLLFAAGLDPEQDESLLDESYPQDASALLNQWVEARCEDRRPVAYIVGEAYLAGARFVVDERALIPRSPIAHLAMEAFQPWWGEAIRPPRSLRCVVVAGIWVFWQQKFSLMHGFGWRIWTHRPCHLHWKTLRCISYTDRVR